jgi:hypothetical protein
MTVDEITLDVPRLRKALEFVTDHPEEWRQLYWAVRSDTCGTKACLAGRIVLQAGVELDWRPDRHLYLQLGVERAQTIAADQTRTIGDQACTLLGVPEAMVDDFHRGYLSGNAYLLMLDFDRLWSGANTLRDLWFYASELTDGEIEMPPADVPLPDGS